MLWVLKRTVSQWDSPFEHPKHIFKPIDKKYCKEKVYAQNVCLTKFAMKYMSQHMRFWYLSHLSHEIIL